MEREVELGGGQVHRALGGAHLAGDGVEVRRAEHDRRGGGRGGPGGQGRGALDGAQQGADAGDQLAGTEGLGQVVVGARREALQQVGLGVARREHQHRDGVLVLDRPAHVEAVEAREHEIEDHEVGGEVVTGPDARRAVGGEVHDEALAAQAGGHGLGDGGLVLDDEDGAGPGR